MNTHRYLKIKKKIIISNEETFSHISGFQKGPRRLKLKTKIIYIELKICLKVKRTENKNFII